MNLPVIVAGAGAFGTALAVALGREGRPVALWARDAGQVAEMAARRENPRGLPGVALPAAVAPVAELAGTEEQTVLLAVPAQALRGFLAAAGAGLAGARLVACCKGIERSTGLRPSEVIAEALPGAPVAVLTGPSFAADIARGLPTALTLACADAGLGRALQAELSTPVLRLYRTRDVAGAELGGALKNVIAIACGAVTGAGLGESARAALMTRGLAEMLRLAVALGAEPATLYGLSGFGDLVLTCTSPQSRNFAYGAALGAGRAPEPGRTVEGRATAAAVVALSARLGIDMPVSAMVARLADGGVSLTEAMAVLLARPLKEED